MTVLSITNIYNPSDNGWNGYGEYVNVLLFFERIIEQTDQQKHHYNYGQLSAEKQSKYLVPLIKQQMVRNGYICSHRNAEEKEEADIPKYVGTLFQKFCDSKRDYIDLSCINEEIKAMHQSLQQILFTDLQFANDDEAEGIFREYKINNKNIKLIFPNLIEYKNHISNWIYVG